MTRPICFSLAAALVSAASLAGLAGAFWIPLEWLPPTSFGRAQAIALAGPLLLGAGGFAASWSLWRYRRRAPEAFLAWVMLLWAGALSLPAFLLPATLAPAVARGMLTADRVEVTVGRQVILLGLWIIPALVLYACLASRRRPRSGERPIGPPPPR